MKKALLIYGLLLIIGISIYLVKDDTNINYQVEIVDEEETITPLLKLCVINEQDEYEMINVDGSRTIDNILSFYNYRRNVLPLDVHAGFHSNFVVDEIDEVNKVISINDFDGNIESIKTMLAWSLHYLKIDNFILNVNNEKYTIDSLPAINIQNKQTENSEKQFIYYFTDLGIRPVTYYHNQSPIDFVCKQLLTEDFPYKYDIYDKTIFLNINSNKSLNSNSISQLYYNLQLLDDIKDVVVTKNGLVLT